MWDRLLRGMNRSFDHGQHLHGSRAACRWHGRAWAWLWNFSPWHPATTRKNEDWRCPAERLNQHRYHACWLQNLLISASLGGYKCPLLQNPLLARVAQDPRPGQALEGGARRGLTPGLGGGSRVRPPQLRATAPIAAAMGDPRAFRSRFGEGPGPVRQARARVDRVAPSRRPPHEQDVGSPAAGDEPLLRSRPTPSRLAGGVPVARPRVGVVVELLALAPSDDAEERGLALPCRTSQPTPLSRLLAAKPLDLRVPRWI